jgi:hypothetical protein
VSVPAPGVYGGWETLGLVWRHLTSAVYGRSRQFAEVEALTVGTGYTPMKEAGADLLGGMSGSSMTRTWRQSWSRVPVAASHRTLVPAPAIAITTSAQQSEDNIVRCPHSVQRCHFPRSDP